MTFETNEQEGKENADLDQKQRSLASPPWRDRANTHTCSSGVSRRQTTRRPSFGSNVKDNVCFRKTCKCPDGTTKHVAGNHIKRVWRKVTNVKNCKANSGVSISAVG